MIEHRRLVEGLDVSIYRSELGYGWALGLCLEVDLHPSEGTAAVTVGGWRLIATWRRCGP